MKTPSPKQARQFVEDLLRQGRYTFTPREAEKALTRSPSATYMALHRMVKAGKLVMPRSGFYVIVDPQHRAAGTLPPEWFISDLMKHLGQNYYVGLLSAAQLHGAAHHRPQVFQVIIPKRRLRSIRAGNVRIRFFGKGPFDNSQVSSIKTPTGLMQASSPETTAWDLVRYWKAAGGLDNVLTVLSELTEKLDRQELRHAIEAHDEPIVAQRLGYLLDRLNRSDLTEGFDRFISDAPLRALDPGASTRKAPKSEKWHLLVNANPEPES